MVCEGGRDQIYTRRRGLNRMQDKQQRKWSARSKTKSAVSFKKTHLVSSFSRQYKIWSAQKEPYLDEIETVQHPRISTRFHKSREALFQLCTIPMSIYLNKPDTQKTVIVPKATQQTQKRGIRRKHISHVLLVVWLLFLCIVGGVLVYGYSYYTTTIHAPLKQLIHPVRRSVEEPALNSTPSYNVIMGRSWNILLMGSDNDGKYTFPDVLTQVMMVVHIDTGTGRVSMVSIPRDSWVQVPGIGGMHKLDQAFFLGASQNNSFDDGVRAARLTIEKDYGIPIDRYAWVGLSGFAKVIDTLGGVDIDITHPIVDDNYPDDTGSGTNPNDPYALKRLSLAPGLQHLNGSQALEYVRSRHADLIGDIGRTQRQQQVLEALKKKLTIEKLLVDLPQIIKDMAGTVYTDLNEQEIIAFANFGRTINSSAIQRVTLGPGIGIQDYGDLASVTDPSLGVKQDVVIPRCDNIQPVVNRIFGLGNKQSCNVGG